MKIKKKLVDKELAKFFYSFSANLGSQLEYSSLGQTSALLFSQKDFCYQSQDWDRSFYCQGQSRAFKTPATGVNITFLKKKSKNNQDHKDLSQIKCYSYK